MGSKNVAKKTRPRLRRPKIELAASAPELLSKPRYMHSLYIKAFRVTACVLLYEKESLLYELLLYEKQSLLYELLRALGGRSIAGETGQ